MPSNYVQVGARKYNLKGAAMEAFSSAYSASVLTDPRDDDARQYELSRRNDFIRAMPPRVRWAALQACHEMARELAFALEAGGKLPAEDGERSE